MKTLDNPNECYYQAAQELYRRAHERYGATYNFGGPGYEDRMKYWENKALEYLTLSHECLRGNKEAILKLLAELGC